MPVRTLLWALALSAVVASSAHAAVVSRLKTATVPLTDEKGTTVDFSRENFKSPWNVKGKNPDGTLQVEVDGKTYTVQPMYVETQGMPSNFVQPVCIDNKDTRLAATRNVGDGCTKK